jgi:hypothetical protein
MAAASIGPLRPANHTANLEIAHKIVRRIAGFRAMQPAAWEADAVVEISRHLDAASGAGRTLMIGD